MIVTVPIKCSTVKKLHDNTYLIGFWCFVACAIIMVGNFVYSVMYNPYNLIIITITFMVSAVFIFFTILLCPYTFNLKFQCIPE